MIREVLTEIYYTIIRTKLLPLVAVVLTLACGRGEEIPEDILALDAQADTAPRAVLDSLPVVAKRYSDASEGVKMRLALLQTKATDKAFILHTSDSTMKAVAKYYEDHGTDNDRLEAYYYMGSVYRDMHDSPKSLTWYRKAIDAVDERAEGTNFKVLSRVYSQLAQLYMRQLNYPDAIECARGALRCKNRTGESRKSAYFVLARLYEAAGVRDSAALYYDKGHFALEDEGMTRSNLELWGELMNYYINCHSTEAAERCFAFINRFDITQLPLNTICAKGHYFLDRSQNDSAEYYLDYALCHEPDVYKQQSIARTLYRLSTMRHDETSRRKYAAIFVACVDSVQRSMAYERTIDADNEYKYVREAENEKSDHNAEMRRKSLFIGSLSLALGVCLILLIITYRQRHTISRAHKVYNDLSRKHNRLETSVAADRRLRALSDADITEVVDYFNSARGTWDEEGKGEIWQKLDAAVDKNFPRFRDTIVGLCPGIGFEDLRLLYLLRIGLSRSRIALIFNCHRSTITHRIRHVESLLGTDVQSLLDSTAAPKDAE